MRTPRIAGAIGTPGRSGEGEAAGHGEGWLAPRGTCVGCCVVFCRGRILLAWLIVGHAYMHWGYRSATAARGKYCWSVRRRTCATDCDCPLLAES